jgi:hypothetical protein
MPKQSSPEPDEALMGFVLRMANANAVQGIHWLYQRLGRDKLNRFKFEDCRDIAYTFGSSVEKVERAMWRRRHQDGMPIHTLDTIIIRKPYLIRPLRPQICSKCLDESGYCRQTWDFQFVCACPIHNCTLIDRCPQCRRYIQWMRPSLLSCNCGAAWTDIEPEPHLPLKASVRVASLVQSKLSPDRATFLPQDPLESALSNLTLDAISKLIWIFGFKEHIDSHVGTGRSQQILRTEDASRCIERGYARLREFGRTAASDQVSTTLDSVHMPALKVFVQEADSIADIRFAEWLSLQAIRQSAGKYKLSRAGHRQLHLF